MKKTMIALATIAAVGAASAQVTITGGISMAAQSNLAKTSGLASTDNTLYVSASEDLGNGIKATAAMTIENDTYRGAAFTRADQSITVSTPTGSLRIANTRSGGNQGAALIAPANLANDQWSSKVITREAIDVAAVIIPLNDQITATISYVEARNNALADAGVTAYDAAVTAGDADAAAAAIVAGLAAASGAVTPAATSVAGSLKYTAGGLTVTAGYTSSTYTSSAMTLIAALRGATAADIQTTSYDVSAIFDAGVAKFGFGYDSSRRGYTSADKSAMLFGVSVPLGAVTLGGNYGSRDAANFLQLAAQYDLSKRTNVNFSWGQDKQSSTADTNSQYRISLNHAF